MKATFNKANDVYPHGSLREQPEMKKGRFSILRSYYNRQYYSGHIRWLLTDEKGESVCCDKCGNIANGIMAIGKFNIPLCKKHGLELFPHLETAPFFETYKKPVAVPIVAQETELQMWKAKAEGNEIIAIERGKAIEELQKQISEKDEELRKAKIYIEALATADMKQIEFWQKFKTEHNL